MYMKCYNQMCNICVIYVFFQLEDVGDLIKLRIGYDNVGLFVGWYLEKVEVRIFNNVLGKVRVLKEVLFMY